VETASEPPDTGGWDPKASTLRRAATGESAGIEVWLRAISWKRWSGSPAEPVDVGGRDPPKAGRVLPRSAGVSVGSRCIEPTSGLPVPPGS
jgi:hypothetical protein